MAQSVKRTAIVTGASRGIGRGIAVALGSIGASVVVNYHSNEAAAQEAVDAVKQAGGDAVAFKADVGCAADRAAMLQAANETFGAVDLLVNNAGISHRVRSELLDMDEATYDEVMNTNLKGPFMLAQLVARQIVAQRDRIDKSVTPTIINIGSISAEAVSTNRSAYCMAKAAMQMMTEVYAAALAPHGVLVYEVRPGIIATDMTAGVTDKYDKLIFEQNLLPIARWGRPEDVGRAVLAIVGGYLNYSTGMTIHVDGGFHVRRL